MSNLSMMTRINDDVIAQLESGIIPWIDHSARTREGFAYNGESGKRYNLLNQLILGQPGAYYTLSSIQRLNERLHLDGDNRVRIGNGESPKWVKMWFPVNRRNQHDDDQPDDETPDTDDDRYMMLKTYKVWHESQLVNLPVCRRQLTHIGDETDQWGSFGFMLTHWFDEAGVTEDVHSDVSCYDPASDYIRSIWHREALPDCTSNEAHEAIHATGHPRRLHRFEADTPVMARGHEANREELVAEMGAAMLAAQFGCTLQLVMSREAYIATWLEVLRANPTMYCTAATRAEKAAKLIAPDLFPDVVNVVAEPVVAEPTVEEAAPVPVTVNCFFCHAEHSLDDVVTIGSQLFCQDCAPHIYTCAGCIDLKHDAGENTTHFGQRFCNTCSEILFPRWHARYQHMHGRYGEPSLHFHGATNHYMGVEIETSPDLQRPEVYDIDRAAGELTYLSSRYDNEPLWHMTTDATINNRLGHGIEVVSHPADIDWWMSHSAIDDFHTVMHGAGFMSHESLDSSGSPTCGLHVHVNREWLIDGMHTRASNAYEVDYVTVKLMAAVQSMLSEASSKSGWSTLERFARRRCNNWCANPGFPVTALNGADRRSCVSKLNHWRDNHSRYHVVNLTNSCTIELRIFRGTTKASTIKATLQFVDNLINFIRNSTLSECKTAGIRDIINYKHWDELEAYAASKNL